MVDCELARLWLTCPKAAQQGVERARFVAIRRKHGDVDVAGGAWLSPPLNRQTAPGITEDPIVFEFTIGNFF